jgi:hypothetical protein
VGSDREVIEQYCELTGVIPPIAEMGYRVKVGDDIPGEVITRAIVSMLIAAAVSLPAFKELEILLGLLKRLADGEDDLVGGRRAIFGGE